MPINTRGKIIKKVVTLSAAALDTTITLTDEIVSTFFGVKIREFTIGFPAAYTGTVSLTNPITAAPLTGTADMSSGNDWSGAGSETLVLQYNQSEEVTVTLNAATTTLATAKAHIQAQINAATDSLGNIPFVSGGVAVFTVGDDGADHITITVAAGSSFRLDSSSTALTTLGFTAGKYSPDTKTRALLTSPPLSSDTEYCRPDIDRWLERNDLINITSSAAITGDVYLWLKLEVETMKQLD